MQIGLQRRSRIAEIRSECYSNKSRNRNIQSFQGTAEISSELKILLGGIPLGCDNIGDEAILAAVVALFKRKFPGARLTVCTAKMPETAKLLEVECAPLYGFDPALKTADFRDLCSRHDFYCWCGATGLSDYPGVACSLLEAAHRAGTPAVVWGVGMDSIFNPAFFQLRGKRRLLCRMLSLMTFNRIDFIHRLEARKIRSIRSRLKKALTPCLAVILRDPESKTELDKTGFTGAIVGADSAIGNPPFAGVPEAVKSPGIFQTGFCISSQRRIADLDSILELWEYLTRDPARKLVLIPMNQKTDSALMRGLADKLSHPERVQLLKTEDPRNVQSSAGNCDAVVSSRLHLLVLALNESVPAVGIERGSKVGNFLSPFGLVPCGTVEHCDIPGIKREIERLTADGGAAFRAKAQAVHAMLETRLERAAEFLVRTINSNIHNLQAKDK